MDDLECSLFRQIIASGKASTLGLSKTLGPNYFGIVASAIVYGITCLQAFYYYRSEKARKDPWILKTLVAFVMFLSTLQEAFVVVHGYHYLIVIFSKPCELLRKIVWYYPGQLLINGVLELSVEGFLIYRVYRLSQTFYVPGFCSVLVLAGAALTFAVPIKLLLSQESTINSLLKERHLGMVNTAVAAFGEACTTIAMWHYLRRNRTGFRRSDSVVTRLVHLTVSTGALTVLISVAEFLSWLLSNRKVGILFFTFLIVYINALLTTLNMRGVVEASSAESSSQGVNSIHLSRIHNLFGQGASAPQLEIAVDHVIELGGVRTNSPSLSNGQSNKSIRTENYKSKESVV